MVMELTERDTDLLILLHRNGALNIEHVREIYGCPSSYHRKRLTKLSKEGYLVRSKGFVQITSRGMAAAGIMGEPKKLRKVDLKRRAGVLSAVRMVPGWSATLTTEVKEKRGLNRSAYIDAYIERNGIGYAVYLIDSKILRPVTLGRLWNEMQEMSLKGLNRVIMLFEHVTAMVLMASKVNKPKMDELLLLPYPGSIELFSAYHSERLPALLQEKLPGVGPLASARLYADYQWQGNYVSILLTNDAVKRYYLSEYYDGPSYQMEKKDVVIVCASDQRKFFANLYSLAKIVSLDRNSLIDNQEKKK